MEERNKTPSASSVIKIVLGILLVSILLYIAFQVVMIMNPNIETRTAIKYDLNDSVDCMALMAMPQEEIFFNEGVPDYLVSNGDKVAAGGELARIFPSSQQAQSFAQAQRVGEEISLLKAAQLSTPGVNIESLLLQAKASLFLMTDKAESGAFFNITSEKSKYQSAVNKTQISTGKMASFEERIALLSDTETQLIAASGEPSVINAPKNGYFVSSKYSQAQQFTQDELKAMTPLQLQQAGESAPVKAVDNLLGRLIYDYKWECYISVNSKFAKKFVEGKKIYICFSENSDNEIPVTITEVTIDEANQTAKVVVTGDYMTEEIASIQHTKATVIFPSGSSQISYTGIRVPKEALRVVDGEYGVYIRYGNLAQYKRIQILFENENYILTSLTYEKGKNELKMYDEIIIEGRGLLPQNSANDSSSASDSSSLIM